MRSEPRELIEGMIEISPFKSTIIRLDLGAQ